MANFNFQITPDYTLNTTLIEEVINLYGINIKFLVASKINRDDLVFGDFSHIKTDNNKIYDLMALPEESAEWNQTENTFSGFGLTNFENINLFISKQMLIDNIPDFANKVESLPGNIIVLPNQKIMEVSQSMWEVPGVNNLFTEQNTKSVLKLSCIPYANKLINEVQPQDVSIDPTVPYTTLDNYFTELVNQTTAQNTAAEVTLTVPSVQKGTSTGGTDTPIDKPIVDKSEPDVWGQFK